MREIVESEAKWILERMKENIGDPYWQGRLDSLAWISRNLPEEG